jgi:quercetin dioxygenase-like cupin family protein
MLGRRLFANCALCAVVAAVTGTGEALAQSAPGGIARKVLNTTDMPGGVLVCIEATAEMDPGALIARHTHPGIESGYMLAGGGTFSMKGQADRQVKAGDSWQIPAETPHAFQNGAEKSKIVVVYTVDKNKPLSTPAPL